MRYNFQTPEIFPIKGGQLIDSIPTSISIGDGETFESGKYDIHLISDGRTFAKLEFGSDQQIIVVTGCLSLQVDVSPGEFFNITCDYGSRGAVIKKL